MYIFQKIFFSLKTDIFNHYTHGKSVMFKKSNKLIMLTIFFILLGSDIMAVHTSKDTMYVSKKISKQWSIKSNKKYDRVIVSEKAELLGVMRRSLNGSGIKSEIERCPLKDKNGNEIYFPLVANDLNSLKCPKDGCNKYFERTKLNQKISKLKTHLISHYRSYFITLAKQMLKKDSCQMCNSFPKDVILEGENGEEKIPAHTRNQLLEHVAGKHVEYHSPDTLKYVSPKFIAHKCQVVKQSKTS